MGLVSPLGLDVATSWAGLLAGRSGIGPLPAAMRECRLRCRVCGVAPEFDAKDFLPRTHRRTMGRVSMLACLAAKEAVAQAGLDDATLSGPRTSVCAGSTTGSSSELDSFFGEFHKHRDAGLIEATKFLKVMSHTVASGVAALLGVRGQVFSPASACATSTQAVGMAMQMIRCGMADVVVCGGADELHETTIGVFDIVRAASENFNDQPTRTPRPFDAQRDGTAISEGAAMLVLEAEDHARARGAAPLGFVRGFGGANHCGHQSQPDADAMVASMHAALADAQLDPGAVGYVNAHATGTVLGDPVEAQAIARVFGESVAVSGVKGYTGHTLAAAGAMEAIFCMEMMRRQTLIATRNLDDIDPQCRGVRHLLQHATQPTQFSLSNSFAFGGVNGTLILEHAES